MFALPRLSPKAKSKGNGGQDYWGDLVRRHDLLHWDNRGDLKIGTGRRENSLRIFNAVQPRMAFHTFPHLPASQAISAPKPPDYFCSQTARLNPDQEMLR
jgi:hypothetical protein